jgi:glutathione peroxidase
MTGLSDFEPRLADGSREAMASHVGKVLLIVNTASKCGFTPQYAELEKLYRDFKDRGFEVLAFPCNQFAGQEPGNAEEIASFCTLTYDVSFPVFAKIDVNGGNADPLWDWLKREKTGLMGIGAIKWNFTKFLVNREGRVVSRHAPTVRPEMLRREIETLLG